MQRAWLVFIFAAVARASGIPIVRSIDDIPEGSYGRPGLSHMTIAGAVHHGIKEIEVWLQTFAPGSGTPIHRHDCQEIFLVIKGTGTLSLAASGVERPGEVAQFRFSTNSTMTIPVNSVHQIINTGDDDLQFYVIISRPPIKVFVYHSFSVPHVEAVAHFPYPWDMTGISAEEGECRMSD